MLQFHAEHFLSINRAISYARGAFKFPSTTFSDEQMAKHESMPVAEGLRKEFIESFRLIKGSCEEIHLDLTVDQLDRIIQGLSRSDYTYSAAERDLEALEWRMTDEFRRRHFLSLSSEEALMLSNPRQGWEEVIKRWPATIDDIIEANSCYALGRYTAVVFHSLQIGEHGLIELGKSIGVTDYKEGWNATIKALDKIVETKHEQLTDFQKEHREFFRQVRATAATLNDAWRNKVSHAQGKLLVMTSDFSPQVAGEILVATRGFMRRLATGLPIP